VLDVAEAMSLVLRLVPVAPVAEDVPVVAPVVVLWSVVVRDVSGVEEATAPVSEGCVVDAVLLEGEVVDVEPLTPTEPEVVEELEELGEVVDVLGCVVLATPDVLLVSGWVDAVLELDGVVLELDGVVLEERLVSVEP
jgi:hypothetical protein